jgi:hypothetical protein
MGHANFHILLPLSHVPTCPNLFFTYIHEEIRQWALHRVYEEAVDPRWDIGQGSFYQSLKGFFTLGHGWDGCWDGKVWTVARSRNWRLRKLRLISNHPNRAEIAPES